MVPEIVKLGEVHRFTSFPTVYWMFPQRGERDPHAELRHLNGKGGAYGGTAFWPELDGRADPEWLLTLLSVLPLNTYTLEEWNEALSQAAGEADLLPVLPDVIRLFTPAGFRSTIAL